MPRVKRGTHRRASRKKTLHQASGYFLTKSKLYRAAQEAVELGDPLVEVGEAHLERILLGKLVVERHGDIFRLVPGERRHIRAYQILVPLRAPRTAVFIMFSARVRVAWFSSSICTRMSR